MTKQKCTKYGLVHSLKLKAANEQKIHQCITFYSIKFLKYVTCDRLNYNQFSNLYGKQRFPGPTLRTCDEDFQRRI